MTTPLLLRNGQKASRHCIPGVSVEEFVQWLADSMEMGQRVSALFGFKEEGETLRIVGVCTNDRDGFFAIKSMVPGNATIPSLTNKYPAVHLFERELVEQYGCRIENHPWLKPVRFQPWLAGGAQSLLPTIGDAAFFRVEGDGVHEVAVGPVHAGVIEPGHFRFQCHGEDVFHLEISLGYQHRGIERALIGGPDKRTFSYMETAAGDTTIGHSLAYCQLIEAITGVEVPPRAHSIRAIALELERCANHCGDLGALAGDVGYLPTNSYCGRIRGDFLNLSALLCGSRFGRGLVIAGGTGFDLDGKRATELTLKLNQTLRDFLNATNLLWDEPSVMARFEETGIVSKEDAKALGMVGPAARASGLFNDVRLDLPTGIYRFFQIPVSTYTTGDVQARSQVRWMEVQRSVEFVKDQVSIMAEGPIFTAVPLLPSDTIAVSCVEGWRGEICHVAITGPDSRFLRYKIVDPSFHNWTGLAWALRNQQISDFPLCNKSFNLSYCGFDL